MKKRILQFFVMFSILYVQGQTIIPLYNGEKAPGSEILTSKEISRKLKNGQVITIRNVSMPTLEVYHTEKDKKNGTAIIICPGGGFTGLAYQEEGTSTAKWCVENGITAFILKYRLMPLDKDPQVHHYDYEVNFDSLVAPYVKLAVADGLEAVRYVKSHSNDYGIDSTRVGIMGYSAGGTVTASVAQTYDKDSRPDFVAPIYAYYGAVLGDSVPEDAPPMFLAWATDDVIAKGNVELYEKWRLAGKSVEMHSFYAGGHGFSVLRKNKPSDIWKDLFKNWLINQGFIVN